ncbi:unnamed protein product, partial [Phaeothamnion confervicola]
CSPRVRLLKSSYGGYGGGGGTLSGRAPAAPMATGRSTGKAAGLLSAAGRGRTAGPTSTACNRYKTARVSHDGQQKLSGHSLKTAFHTQKFPMRRDSTSVGRIQPFPRPHTA